jgi:hypothetical protein
MRTIDHGCSELEAIKEHECASGDSQMPVKSIASGFCINDIRSSSILKKRLEPQEQHHHAALI